MDIIFDRGEGAPEAEIGSIFFHIDASSTTLTTSSDGATYGSALSPGDTLKRYVKFNLIKGGGPVLQELRITPTVFDTVFHTYFPFSVGNVPAPSVTGVSAVASTVYEGSSTSEIVTCADADIETLVQATLENPAGSGSSASYTPTNSGHWNSPLPENVNDATNRLAYAYNEIFWDQIP